MNLNLSRGALLVVFLVFLMAQIVIIYSVGVANRVFVDEEMALITQVLSIYSVQLAVILGGMFAMKKTALPQATPFLVWSAIGLSLMWNSLLLGGTLLFAVSDAWKIHDIRSYLETVSRSSSFLVAGALALFFASPAGRTEGSVKRNKAEKRGRDEK
jgi:hypothetical protein